MLKFIRRLLGLHHSLRVELWMLFGLALIFRIFIIVLVAWNREVHFESIEIARYLLRGLGYSWDWYGQIPVQPTAIFTPLYTYFLAFFLWVFPEPARWIYLAQAALNALVVFPAYALGNLLGGKRNGLVLALLFAFFPEVAYMPTKMVSEAVILAPFILAFYLFLKLKFGLQQSFSSRAYFYLGILIGFLSLVKESALCLVLGCCLSLLAAQDKGKALRAAAWLLVGTCLAVSPWLARNTLVFDQPIFRTGYGFNLWLGNHPGASGTFRACPQTRITDTLDAATQAALLRHQPRTELGLDAFYRAEAVRFIRLQPGEYVRLTLMRMLYYFTWDPTHPLTRNFVYLGGYACIVVLGVWGGWILRQRQQGDVFFLAAPLVYLALYAPVLMLPRYRLVLVWILLVLSSVALTQMFNRMHVNLSGRARSSGSASADTITHSGPGGRTRRSAACW